jgi:hypothetical protein
MAGIPVLDRVRLMIEPYEQVIICCWDQYRIGLSNDPLQVNNHLCNKYSLPLDDRRAATSLLRFRISIINNAASILPRKDGSEIHPYLRVYDGFACSYYILCTISKSTISRHVTDIHRQKMFELRARTDEMYIPVYLQAWTRNPVDGQYWIIEKNGNNT